MKSLLDRHGRPRVVCPAAQSVAGAATGLSGVVCRVMDLERPQMDQIAEGRTEGRFHTIKSDPATVVNLCCGRDELPATADQAEREEEEGHVRSCYGSCPVWQAEIQRREDRRARLLERIQADPNAIYPFHTPPTTGGARTPREGFDRAQEVLEMIEEEKAST